VATGIWESDKWDEQAMHEFVAVAMRSVEPLPDMSSLLQRPVWQLRAACRGRGVTEFFRPDGSSRVRATVVCASCPVTEDCLEYALDHPSLKGVWAGTSERGRHRIRATLGKGVEALSGPMPGTPQRSSSSPRHKSAAHGHR
jgi:WhiB family redox-sensing transcriptional regulator